MLHQLRPVFSVSLSITLLQLLFLLINTGSSQLICVNTRGGGDDTCEAELFCYLSNLKFLNSSGLWESYDEWGCINFPGFCPINTVIERFHDTPVSYQAFNCCQDGNFCNENLTVVNDYPMLTSTPPTATLLTSTPDRSPTSTSPILGSSPPLSWFVIVGIIALFLAIVTVVATVVGLSIYYGNCCPVSYLSKCGIKVCYLCRYHHHSKARSDDANGIDFNSIPMEIDPVPITDNDISITSGSGKGMPHLVQRTIARSFVLGNAIGGGRFGQVYIGYYQGEQYAVKKFFSRDEQSWYHETEIYNTINMRHDNILSCFATDILSNNGVTELWLITQYQPRGSLYDVLSTESVDQETVLKFAISICRGLTYLHDELSGTQGKPAIAHRDIKSKNILVKENYTCCIADFGMALVKNSSSPNLTTPQNIREGTKRYMAPEILAETINLSTFESFLRTDMYAYGLVVWEVCRRCDFADEPEEYELPFMSMVPPDPSFEDMREMVAERGCSPQIPNRWASSELLKSLTMLMKECWYSEPAARPTAFYVKKKLERITQNSQLKFPSEKS